MYTRWTHLLFLQTTLKEYEYIYKDNKESSLEEAEEMCSRYKDYHLISLSSHEEQQLIQALFKDLSSVNHRSTYYIFISLKKQVNVHNNVCTCTYMDLYGTPVIRILTDKLP